MELTQEQFKRILKLQRVFMKHYAPNICLPLTDNLETIMLYYTKCLSRKRGDNSVKYLQKSANS